MPLAPCRVSSCALAAQLRARRRRRRVGRSRSRSRSAPRRVDVESKRGSWGRRRAWAQVRFGEVRVFGEEIAGADHGGAVAWASRRAWAEPNAPLFHERRRGAWARVGSDRRGRCVAWGCRVSGVVVRHNTNVIPDSPRPLLIAGHEAVKAGHPTRGTSDGSQASEAPPLAAGSWTRAGAAPWARSPRPGRKRGRASEPAPRTALAAAAWPR